MIHKSSFDVKTVHDFLHKMLSPQYEEFRANNSSPRHALLTIILVNHMREWVKPEPSYPKHIDEMFKLVRKIANGTKHFEPRAKTWVQTGFSSGFSDAFARPLNVEFPGNRKLSVDKLLDKLVEFWKEQDRLGTLKSRQ